MKKYLGWLLFFGLLLFGYTVERDNYKIKGNYFSHIDNSGDSTLSIDSSSLRLYRGSTVGNTVTGKPIILYRKAAEGTDSIMIYIDANRKARIIVSGDTLFIDDILKANRAVIDSIIGYLKGESDSSIISDTAHYAENSLDSSWAYAEATDSLATPKLKVDFIVPNDSLYVDFATGRGATFVVAASNSHPQIKKQADWVCDGTNDNVEIQEMIDSINTIGGGVLLFAEGNFSIGSTITLKSNVTLRGMGLNSIISISSNAPLFTATGTLGNEITNIIIEDLNLIGAGSGNGSNALIAFDNYVEKVWINRCCFSEAGYDAIYMLRHCKYIYITNCYVRNCYDDGINPGGHSDGGTKHIYICFNDIKGIVNDGIHISNGSSVVKAIGNTIDSCGDGIGIFNSGHNIIALNHITNCDTGIVTVSGSCPSLKITENIINTTIGGAGIKLTHNADSVDISNNTIISPATDGIYIDDKYGLISNNTIRNCGDKAIEDIGGYNQILYNKTDNDIIAPKTSNLIKLNALGFSKNWEYQKKRLTLLYTSDQIKLIQLANGIITNGNLNSLYENFLGDWYEVDTVYVDSISFCVQSYNADTTVFDSLKIGFSVLGSGISKWIVTHDTLYSGNGYKTWTYSTNWKFHDISFLKYFNMYGYNNEGTTTTDDFILYAPIFYIRIYRDLQ